DGPGVLGVLEPGSESIKKFSSEDKATPVDPNTLDIPAFWIKSPPILSKAAGMHRWVWDLRPTPPAVPAGQGNGFRRGVSSVLPGTYSVKLTVGGQSYTQPLVIKMDPRVK